MKNIFLLFFFFAATSHAAVSFVIDPQTSETEFLAIGHPSSIKIKGSHAKPEGKIVLANNGSVNGLVKINLEEFDSGIGLRDKHMKEKYLEVGKSDYKTATLTLTKIDLPKDFWKNPHAIDTTFVGKLHLHGHEKDVSGQMSLSSVSGQAAQGDAKFTVALPDYGISVPSFSGITVAEKVDINVNFKGSLKTL